MKTIYTIWNYDVDDVVISSEDKDLLQEIMCDMYMDDCYESYLWDLLWRDNGMDIQDIFESMLDFYEDYIGIVESQVIE